MQKKELEASKIGFLRKAYRTYRGEHDLPPATSLTSQTRRVGCSERLTATVPPTAPPHLHARDSDPTTRAVAEPLAEHENKKSLPIFLHP